MEDGARCFLCPELGQHQLPQQACAIVKKSGENKSSIGCQQLPDLCVSEFRSRYTDFYDAMDRKFKAGLILKNKKTSPKTQSTFLNINGLFTKKIHLLATTTLLPQTTTIDFSTDTEATPVDELASNDLETGVRTSIMNKNLDKNFTTKFFEAPQLIESTTHLPSSPLPPTQSHSFLSSMSRLNKSKAVLPFDAKGRSKIKDLIMKKNKRVMKNIESPTEFETTTGKTLTESTTTDFMESTTNFDNNILSTQSLPTAQSHVPIPKRICKDRHKLCCFWALSGECKLNPWMMINCGSACGTCHCTLREADKCVSIGIKCELPTTIQPTTTLRITTTDSTPPGKLNNNSTTFKNATSPSVPSLKNDKKVEERKLLSNKSLINHRKNGKQIINTGAIFTEKTTKRVVVTTTAPQHTTTTIEPTTSTTKKYYQSTEKPCEDYHKNCRFWALLGECVKNPFWLRTRCQKSCNSCGDEIDTIFAPKPSKGCVNHHKLCQFWAYNKQCHLNPNWMLVHCACACANYHF
uniref:ShKT domain-containing protein n=1 Tax=Rhabditophanes sp. KR3021 TaxID=114890 RepID=A0AC35U641_9BILA